MCLACVRCSPLHRLRSPFCSIVTMPHDCWQLQRSCSDSLGYQAVAWQLLQKLRYDPMQCSPLLSGESPPALHTISIHVVTSDLSDTRTESGWNILEPLFHLFITMSPCSYHNSQFNTNLIFLFIHITIFNIWKETERKLKSKSKSWRDLLLWTDVEEMRVGHLFRWEHNFSGSELCLNLDTADRWQLYYLSE